MLPQKVYEALRWIIAIVLPAIGVLIVTINNVWNLGWPAEQISLTLDAVGLFLGAIFGISKVVNDKKA
jgi:uncharacterized membrane protein YeiH